jgi:hypothetical protein
MDPSPTTQILPHPAPRSSPYQTALTTPSRPSDFLPPEAQNPSQRPVNRPSKIVQIVLQSSCTDLCIAESKMACFKSFTGTYMTIPHPEGLNHPAPSIRISPLRHGICPRT